MQKGDWRFTSEDMGAVGQPAGQPPQPLTTAASFAKFGPAALYRDTGMFPSIRRAAPTGPLQYSDVWTGNCDSRAIRQSFEAAKDRCRDLLPNSRLGEYLTCVNAYALSARNAAGCDAQRDLAVATDTFQHTPPAAQTPAQFVQQACANPDNVFPSVAAQQACVARYSALAREGFSSVDHPEIYESVDPWAVTDTDYALMGVQPKWSLRHAAINRGRLGSSA